MNIIDIANAIFRHTTSIPAPYWSCWHSFISQQYPRWLLQKMTNSIQNWYPDSAADIDLFNPSLNFSYEAINHLLNLAIGANVHFFHHCFQKTTSGTHFTHYLTNFRQQSIDGGWTTQTPCAEHCALTGRLLRAFPTHHDQVLHHLEYLYTKPHLTQNDWNWLYLVCDSGCLDHRSKEQLNSIIQKFPGPNRQTTPP